MKRRDQMSLWIDDWRQWEMNQKSVWWQLNSSHLFLFVKIFKKIFNFWSNLFFSCWSVWRRKFLWENDQIDSDCRTLCNFSSTKTKDFQHRVDFLFIWVKKKRKRNLFNQKLTQMFLYLDKMMFGRWRRSHFFSLNVFSKNVNR